MTSPQGTPVAFRPYTIIDNHVTREWAMGTAAFRYGGEDYTIHTALDPATRIFIAKGVDQHGRTVADRYGWPIFRRAATESEAIVLMQDWIKAQRVQWSEEHLKFPSDDEVAGQAVHPDK